MIRKLSNRLKWCLQHGPLSQADLAIWFSRPRPTLHVWIADRGQPHSFYQGEIEQRLIALENVIKQHEGKPIVPYETVTKDRAIHIARLFNDIRGNPPVPKEDTSR